MAFIRIFIVMSGTSLLYYFIHMCIIGELNNMKRWEFCHQEHGERVLIINDIVFGSVLRQGLAVWIACTHTILFVYFCTGFEAGFSGIHWDEKEYLVGDFAMSYFTWFDMQHMESPFPTYLYLSIYLYFRIDVVFSWDYIYSC